MRVAALEIPDLVLQWALRERGREASDAVVLTSTAAAGTGVVVAATPAAFDQGVRLEQPVAQARALVPGLAVWGADFARAGTSLCALAEALGAVSPAVEVSFPEALLLDASAAAFVTGQGEDSERAWGERVLQLVRQHGLSGRLCVADTPLAARLVATMPGDLLVRIVAPGQQGPALAGLSSRALERLCSLQARQLPVMSREGSGPALLPSIPPETFRRLEEWGLRRLGQWQQLPAGALIERLGRQGEELVALGRGGRPRPLVAWRARLGIEETAEFESGVEQASALVFLLRPLVERLLSRLEGRGRALTQLALVLETEDHEAASQPGAAAPPRAAHGLGLRRRQVELVLGWSRPVAQSRPVLELLRDRLERWQGASAVLRATLLVRETGARRDQLVLGDRPKALEAFESVQARLQGRLGASNVGRLVACPTHLAEESSELRPFRLVPRRWAEAAPRPAVANETAVGTETAVATEAAGAPVGEASGPLRRWAPEEAVPELEASGAWRALRWRGRRHLVLSRSAPARVSTRWWSGPVVRDHAELLLSDGIRLRLFQDAEGRWWVEGAYD